MLWIMATVVLRFTNPSFQGDSTLGGCESDLRLPAHLNVVRLYRALIPYGGKVLMRSHPATAGAPDTFRVEDAPAASYFVTTTNDAGESCEAGITIGIPSVSVPPPLTETRPQLYDLAGRRVPFPPRERGVYFTKDRKIVLWR